MNRTKSWLAGLALAGGAVLVTALTPPASAEVASFVTTAAIGERADGREMRIRVDEVLVTDHLVEDTGWDTAEHEGTWVVVHLTADATREPTTNWLSYTRLDLGGRTFSVSRRVDAQATSATFQPGLPLSGSLAFEVPEDALDSDGAVIFTQGDVQPLLDSLLRVEVDLSSVPVRGQVDIAPMERGTW